MMTRSMTRLRAISTLALATSAIACGESQPPQPPPGAFDVTIGCTPATAWAFPETALGQTASALLLATRTAEGDPGGAAAQHAVDGPDAGMFHVAGSTCEGGSFAPGDTCVVLVEYTPTAEGPHAASLHLGKTTLPLGGTASATPQGLVASIRNATSMHGVHNVASSHIVRLVNQAATAITLGTGTFTGTGAEFAASNGCPAVLTPGTACEIQLAVGVQNEGCAAATYHLPSSLNTVEIPLSLSFVGGVSVSLSGMGAGRIVSSPPGIDCHRDPASEGPGEGRCAQVFATPVTLTAIPDPGHHFNGWRDRRCAYDETCTVAPVILRHNRPTIGSAGATFASPEAKPIEVTFAGSGKGFLRGAVTCESSCTGWIEAGERGQLVARSPSPFTGWSGACSGTTRTCDLGIVINDRATTATFGMDDREQATLFPRHLSWIAQGGITTDGELVVAGSDTERSSTRTMLITRLSLAGDIRWTTRVAATGGTSLEIAPGGEIYFFGAVAGAAAGTLIKLDAAGGVVWERATPAPGYAGSGSLAVTPSGGAAILVGSGAASEVRTYAADGSIAWSAAAPAAAGVAVAPTGITAVVSTTDSASIVRRFGAGGAPLTPDWTLPPSNPSHPISLAYDPQGFLSVQILRDYYPAWPTYTLTRLDGTGATIFAKPIAVPVSAAVPARGGGIAVAPSGTVFSWIAHAYTGRIGGYTGGALLETYDPQGSRTWVVDKPATPGRYFIVEGVIVSDVACRPGRCAVLGSYSLDGWSVDQPDTLPWIEVFTVP
jgi:hypothetical protein